VGKYLKRLAKVKPAFFQQLRMLDHSRLADRIPQTYLSLIVGMKHFSYRASCHLNQAWRLLKSLATVFQARV
jgi:hypothetical protein